MKAQEGHRASEHLIGNLVMAPFAGLAYVIVLPFIAIGTVLTLITKKVGVKAYHAIATLASFGWRPMEAYLAGKKNRRVK